MEKETLKPYWDKLDPRALRLKAGMPNLGEDSPTLSDKEFDEQYIELLSLAEEGGNPEARYWYACNLYEQGEIHKALKLYLSTAQKDYAPAQWCYGLNVLHGNSVAKNEELGIYYIGMPAEQRYKNAIEFMINAFESEKYGLQKDDIKLKKWKAILPFCTHHYD